MRSGEVTARGDSLRVEDKLKVGACGVVGEEGVWS